MLQLFNLADAALEYQLLDRIGFLREEADTVQEGSMLLGWKPHKRAQKDVDANWTKKHGKNHFSYKLHASVDQRCKLIRKIAVTHAYRSAGLHR